MSQARSLALATLLAASALGACRSSREELFATEKSQVEMRQMQSRAFETTDRIGVVRAVIATLQDLGFAIEKADGTLGTVSATKIENYSLRVTVSTRPRGKTQMIVRASAQYNLEQVADPAPYQRFFAALGKALFLDAQEVD